MISKVRQHPKFNLSKLDAYKLMFAMIFSMEQDSIELNPKPLANAPSKTLDISNAPKMS